MSRWMDFANALGEHVKATVPACSMDLDEADRVDVVVMRQHDLLAAVNASVGKAKGLCVVIAWTGGRNPDRKASHLRMGGTYSLSVWALPIQEADDLKADDLLEQFLETAHGFVAEHGPNDRIKRLLVGDAKLVPHPTFLIYEAPGEVDIL
jgi:hypothetical protein